MENKRNENAKKIASAVDKSVSLAESASSIASAFKWGCILIVFLIFSFFSYKIYSSVKKVASMPSDAVSAVTDAAKSGGDAIGNRVDSVSSRLLVDRPRSKNFDNAASKAFDVLYTYSIEYEGRIKNPLHNKGRCVFDLDFGGGVVPVAISADKDLYSNSSSIGDYSKKNMSLKINAKKKASFLLSWSEELKTWSIRWSKSTVKKPISDKLAYNNIDLVLSKVEGFCKNV